MPDPILINTAAAAKMLSVSPRTLWNWTASGEIQCVRKGKVLRYDPEVLRQWVSAHSMSGPGKHTNSNDRSGNGQFQRRQT